MVVDTCVGAYLSPSSDWRALEVWCQYSMVLGGWIVGEGAACVGGAADPLCCSGCTLCFWLRIRRYQRRFVAPAVCLYLSPSWFLVTSGAVASVDGRSWLVYVVRRIAGCAVV